MEKVSSKKQFVVQEHQTAGGVHWDLMLEHEGKLWTWRIGIHPSKIRHRPVTTERIFDHPLKFLTYEGPVQNGTASVTIVDKGFLCLHQIATENITCEFDGEFLKGLFDLRLQHAPIWTFAPADA